MSQEAIEARVARLEEQVSRLLGGHPDNGEPGRGELGRGEPGRDEWKETFGMFRGDPIFKEMIEETQRGREEDRRRTRETTGSDDE